MMLCLHNLFQNEIIALIVYSVLVEEVVEEEQSSEEHGLHVGVGAGGEGEQEPGEKQEKE